MFVFQNPADRKFPTGTGNVLIYLVYALVTIKLYFKAEYLYGQIKKNRYRYFTGTVCGMLGVRTIQGTYPGCPEYE
jgi:hypothetical protein